MIDRRLKVAINKAAIKYKISDSLVQEAVEDLFKQIKDLTASDDLPKILLHGFGKFNVKKATLNRYLLEMIRQYKHGNRSREDVVDKVSRYWPARQRLIKEEGWSKKKGRKLKRPGDS